MLAVLLIPDRMEFRDLFQLRTAFGQVLGRDSSYVLIIIIISSSSSISLINVFYCYDYCYYD